MCHDLQPHTHLKILQPLGPGGCSRNCEDRRLLRAGLLGHVRPCKLSHRMPKKWELNIQGRDPTRGKASS